MDILAAVHSISGGTANYTHVVIVAGGQWGVRARLDLEPTQSACAEGLSIHPAWKCPEGRGVLADRSQQ